MSLNDDDLNKIASLILQESRHLFPSTYPDIPLNITMFKRALKKSGSKVSESEINEIMNAAELKFAAIAPLNWNNFGTIAILLNQKFPGEDPAAISHKRIAEMVRKFPNFSDEKDPDEETLNSVIYTWVSLTEDDYKEDYPEIADDDTWN
ncbi:MAG: Fe-S cluster assembly protein IscX [Lentimicrobium sp.]|nr:Fe-S cluster assembly protein IscX [Lentimicrobium sp.]